MQVDPYNGCKMVVVVVNVHYSDVYNCRVSNVSLNLNHKLRDISCGLRTGKNSQYLPD